MKNGSPSKVTGIGTIQIRIHDETIRHCQMLGMCLT
ncbi:hypothetical protein Golob_024246 [Gossypium lobatum]|uniref:Uncharacterized protein n=1 Tax=Gossypium lobatum TaxID=34289 RepID=A0A7J8NFV6_9ROSI|nr:hypothetical protein [Gossypium lobatum]